MTLERFRRAVLSFTTAERDALLNLAAQTAMELLVLSGEHEVRMKAYEVLTTLKPEWAVQCLRPNPMGNGWNASDYAPDRWS